jgi:hypothetical protein
MKQGKINLKPIREPSDQKADSKSTVLENDLLNHTAIINLMPLISIIIAVLPGIIRKSPSVEIAKLGILTLILTAASSFFIRMNADTILNKKFAKSIIAISYFVSLGLLLLARHPENFNFWMLGGFVVAMLIDNKLGLLLHFNLSFILGISFSLRPETVIYLLVIGVLISLLASSLRQKSTVIYAAIILLSTNVTLSFVINNFIFDKNADFNYISSFFSIFAVLVAAFLLCVLYDHIILKMNGKEVPETAQGESSAAGEAEQRTVVHFAHHYSTRVIVVAEAVITFEHIGMNSTRVYGFRHSFCHIHKRPESVGAIISARQPSAPVISSGR